MNLLVGLGNPGENFESTRHNIGYMVVDKLSKELTAPAAAWDRQQKFQALVARAGDIILLKPITFMNNSGLAVKAAADFYKVKPQDIWVIHDDLDLPLGKIRIRAKGGTAGHNGVDSILTHLKSDEFIRFRLGIGRGKEALVKHTDQNLRHRKVIDFVLSRFTQGEAGELRKLIKHAAEAVQIGLNDGLDKAMNRFN